MPGVGSNNKWQHATCIKKVICQKKLPKNMLLLKIHNFYPIITNTKLGQTEVLMSFSFYPSGFLIKAYFLRVYIRLRPTVENSLVTFQIEMPYPGLKKSPQLTIPKNPGGVFKKSAVHWGFQCLIPRPHTPTTWPPPPGRVWHLYFQITYD